MLPSTQIRLMRVAAFVLFFVVVGPPVGGIVFVVVQRGPDGSLSELPGLMFFAAATIPFSYMPGAFPAALAGAMIGLNQIWFGGTSWIRAAGIGSVIGLICSVNANRIVIEGFGGGYTNVSARPSSVFLACLVSTIVCWYAVRNWYTNKKRGLKTI